MKYLLIKKARYSLGYELEEFASAEQLAEKLLAHGLGEDAIIAQRIGIEMQVCEWRKPAETPVDLQEAA